MKTRRATNHPMLIITALSAVLWAAACGGGGGASLQSAPVRTGTPKAVVTLTTDGSLGEGTTIGGLGITIALPDSVTVSRTADGEVDSSVVQTSGAADGQATVLVLYSGPTAAEPAKLHIVLASSASGFAVGEFATISCEVRPGAYPAASDFALSDFAPFDLSGAAIPSLAAGLQVAAP